MRREMRSVSQGLLFFSLAVFTNHSSGQSSRQYNSFRTEILNPYQYKCFIKNAGQFKDLQKEINDSIYFMYKCDNYQLFFLSRGVRIRKHLVQNKDEHGPKSFKENKDERMREVHHEDYSITFFDNYERVMVLGKSIESFKFNYGTQQNGSLGIQATAFRSIEYKDSSDNILIEVCSSIENNKLHLTMNSRRIADVIKSLESLGLYSTVQIPEGYSRINSPSVEFRTPLDSLTSTYDRISENEKVLEKNSILNNNIDILVLTLNTSTNYAKPYDVDYDHMGNIYAYGGSYPYEEMKFDSAGNLLWVYISNIFGPYTYYGDFAIDKKSGSSYLFECWNFSSQAIKLNSNGIQTNYFAGNNQLQEIYRVQLNECTGKLIIAGGAQPSNSAIIDTNFTNLQLINFFSSTSMGHDFCMLTGDKEGNLYFASTGLAGIPFDNVIAKANAQSIHPLSYIVFDNYHFEEAGSINYIPNNKRAGYNGMSAGHLFLYSYDGQLLQKWDKNTGELKDSITVSPQSFLFGGIGVNNCEELFVAVADKVLKMDSLFNILDTYLMPDTVYDLKISEKNTLYACGKNFVLAIKISDTNCSSLFTEVSSVSCSQFGQITLTNVGGVPPYHYNWNPPVSTGSQASELPEGIYTISISDNACASEKQQTTINVHIELESPLEILSPDTICQGIAVTIHSSKPGSLYWNTGDTTAQINVYPDSSFVLCLTYHNEVGCKDTAIKKIIVMPKPEIHVYGNDSVCEGESVKINVSGADIYLWNNGETQEMIEVWPPVSTTYYVAGSNGFCSVMDSFFINVISKPKVHVSSVTSDEFNFVLLANSNYPIKWINLPEVPCDTCKLITYHTENSDTICVETKNELGCSDTACLIVYTPKLFIPNSFTPNGDELNDVFIPVMKDITNYSLIIFSRWGEKLFYTTDSNTGWDGSSEGVPCEAGVYAYLISYRYKGDGRVLTSAGKLILIR